MSNDPLCSPVLKKHSQAPRGESPGVSSDLLWGAFLILFQVRSSGESLKAMPRIGLVFCAHETYNIRFFETGNTNHLGSQKTTFFALHLPKSP
jgi:hypothetical protein